MQIYIAEGTQQTGPFDLDTIKSGLGTGKYQPTQLAWYAGAPGWEPISKLPGMETAAAAPPMPPMPPPPPAYSPAPYSPAPSAYSPNPTSPPTPYSSAPSAPPAPYSAAQTPPAPYGSIPPTPYGTVGTPPPKTSWWGRIGGVLVGLLAIVGGVSRISRAFHSSGSSSSSSYQSASTPAPTPVPTTKYDNNADQFTSGERQKYYVNFHLVYPSYWELASGPKTARAENFVELNRLYRGSYIESFTVEDFYTNSPSLAADLPKVGATYMAGFDTNSKKSTTSYQRISEGPTKFKDYAAYEYRSQYVGKTTDTHQPYTIYLRYLIVAPPTGKNGVILEMTANSFSPDVHGIDDVGSKDEMAAILQSFDFM